MAGRMIHGVAALAELIHPAGATDEPGVHRILPVLPELSGLLPGRGLRRGGTVAVLAGRVRAGQAVSGHAAPDNAVPGHAGPGHAGPGHAGPGHAGPGHAGPGHAGPGHAGAGPAATVVAGGGSTSLMLALLSAASRSGSWCAVVGLPALGALAAAESGVALDRLALVPHPGPEWPTVVAALIDGVDVVVAAVPGTISASVATRLAARARQRGSVLMPYGRWTGADVTLQVMHGAWEGLGTGRGRLRRREVTVVARGRGAAARPKEITMWMPDTTAAVRHRHTPASTAVPVSVVPARAAP